MATEGVAQVECLATCQSKAGWVVTITAEVACNAGYVQSETTITAIVACNADHRQATIGKAPCECRAVVLSKFAAAGTIQAIVACNATQDTHGRDPGLSRYELFHALDGAPFDFSTPDETFASLPHTTSSTFTGNGKHRFVVRRRNAYNRVDSGRREHVIYVRQTNQSWPGPPSAPYDCRVGQYDTRYATFRAHYYPLLDPPDRRATHFAFWYTTDGGGFPGGTPADTEAMRTIVDGVAVLATHYKGEALPDEAVLRAWFAVYFLEPGVGIQYSDLIEAPSITIDWDVPDPPVLRRVGHLREL